MKIYELPLNESESINNFLRMYDLENIFNIYKTDDNNYIFNINNTIYFNIDEQSINTLVLDYPSHWTLISYKIYGTTRLTWLLWKLNGINKDNIWKIQDAGTKIKYLNVDIVENIIMDINNITT